MPISPKVGSYFYVFTQNVGSLHRIGEQWGSMLNFIITFTEDYSFSAEAYSSFLDVARSPRLR